MTLINHTFLVGAGGTGSYLAAPLARLLKYHPNADESFTIIDGDDFEEHNAARQACGADDLGAARGGDARGRGGAHGGAGDAGAGGEHNGGGGDSGHRRAE